MILRTKGPCRKTGDARQGARMPPLQGWLERTTCATTPVGGGCLSRGRGTGFSGEGGRRLGGGGLALGAVPGVDLPPAPVPAVPRVAREGGGRSARRGERLRPRAVAPPLGGAVCPPSAGGTRRQRLVRCLRAAATTRTTRAHFRCYLHGRLLSSRGSVPIARRSSQPPAGRGSLREGGRRLRQSGPPRT
jgi:hypothetical protein